jgi:hypothetical protein
MKKIVKFHGITYSVSVLTFKKAKVIQPSLTETEYNNLIGIVPKKELKKEEKKEERKVEK